MSGSRSSTMYAGIATLSDARWHMQQQAQAALGRCPDALQSFSAARIRRWSGQRTQLYRWQHFVLVPLCQPAGAWSPRRRSTFDAHDSAVGPDAGSRHDVHGTAAVRTAIVSNYAKLSFTFGFSCSSINGSIPSCCGGKDFHPSCFPIKVPLDDPWLSPLKVRCLEFLRSAPAQRRDCVLSWREQTNQATSYIDASPIYSNSAKSSDNARIFRNGLLIYGRGNPAEDVCQRGAIATQCIRSGDGRSGEQPGLLAMHHVWVGEHNRIAMEISELNPHWSDEKIYQETRRIIGAMFQHITYREFLPVVLGQEVCKLFDLELMSTGYYEGYDPKVNPTVANAFSSAAFRFGHSLVQNSYMRCDRHHNIINNSES